MATLVPYAGLAIIAKRMLGTSPTQPAPTYLAWGTGAGTSASADTTLFTEDSGGSPAYARISCTASTVTTSQTNDTHQLVGTITSNGSHTITNAGIFDASATGNLYIKTDFTGLALTSGDAIQFTFKVQIT